ncbi:MAG: hypothetical protein WCF67_18690 [Chitinophagaceae bacterium]
MKTILFAVIAITLFSSTAKDKLTGRWESISATGNVTGVVFKEDNTFEGYINKKPFVSGFYTLRDSTFTMEDNGCMSLVGTYKLLFFNNDDSLRLELIEDPCTGRGQGTNGRVFGRVK